MSGKLPKSGKEVAKQSWAKTDVRYWEKAVFKPKYGHPKNKDRSGGILPGDGARETRHYSVRISHQGRRHTIPLGVANKNDAARKAKEIYVALISAGWEETLRLHHPLHVNRQEIVAGPGEVTIGAYIEAAEAVLSGVSARTLAGYLSSLRKIAGSIAGVKCSAARFDHKSGGRDRWVAQVDALPLSLLTTVEIERWKRDFLKKRKGNPVGERKARNSVNSFIRQARSLFAPKIVRLLDSSLHLPEPLPFSDVTLFPRSSMRYTSKIDISKIVRDARIELGSPRREGEAALEYACRLEQFKIFLLATYGGLRRNEIDKLLWEQVDFENGSVEIRETQHFRPKSEDSRGRIELEAEVVQVLSELRKTSAGLFVIAASGAGRKTKAAQWYRAKNHFDGLIEWLRMKGVDDDKPLHVLRKEAGSLVCSSLGLHAASRFLRHSDIRVTAEHYLDTKVKVTVGMGALLEDLTSRMGGSSAD